jgi:hypothetical protein
MAKTNEEVSAALNAEYAKYGGPGIEAHRDFATYMEKNNISVQQVANITGYPLADVQSAFNDLISPASKGEVFKQFYEQNPNASEPEIFQFMEQNNVPPAQVIQMYNLNPETAMARYDELKADATTGATTTAIEDMPVGLAGFEQAATTGLTNATSTAKAAQEASRGDINTATDKITNLIGSNITGFGDAEKKATGQIDTGYNAALGSINQLYGQNIEGLTGAGASAAQQVSGGFDQGLETLNRLYGQNIQGLGAAGTRAEQQVGSSYDQGIETLNRLYGINIDDLRAAASQASGQINTGFDEARGGINQLYGQNIDDLRAAGTQSSGQINTGFDEARGYFQPYQQGGTQAFNQQMALSGALGQDAFNQARQESPYEKFLFDQGMRANLAGASATGGLGGGNVQKELQRFGQGMASQGLQQQIANLGQLSGMGMQGSQALSGLATGRAGALGEIGMNTAQNIAGQRGTQAQALSGLATGRAGALGDIAMNTAQNITGQRGNQAQSVSGLQTQRGGAISDIALNTAQNIAGQRGNQAQSVSGLQTGRGSALGEIGMNTAQNVAGQRGNQAQSVSGLQTGRAGALSDITTNAMTNIANQRGNQAQFAGQAGLNLANIGQQTGQNIAQMQYGTGQDIASQRARVGELQANQLQDAYANQSNLLNSLGINQSNMIGQQSDDLINMQNYYANRAAQNALGLSGDIGQLRTGLYSQQNNAYTGTPIQQSQPFNYSDLLGGGFDAYSGGYDMQNQILAGRNRRNTYGGFMPGDPGYNPMPSYQRNTNTGYDPNGLINPIYSGSYRNFEGLA